MAPRPCRSRHPLRQPPVASPLAACSRRRSQRRSWWGGRRGPHRRSLVTEHARNNEDSESYVSPPLSCRIAHGRAVMSLYSLSVSALLVGLSATPGDADEFSQSAAARCRPDVSVVIAAHNAEAYIGETIESILAQEGVTCEILVMDDGSRDGTADVVKSFG